MEGEAAPMLEGLRGMFSGLREMVSELREEVAPAVQGAAQAMRGHALRELSLASGYAATVPLAAATDMLLTRAALKQANLSRYAGRPARAAADARAVLMTTPSRVVFRVLMALFLGFALAQIEPLLEASSRDPALEDEEPPPPRFLKLNPKIQSTCAPNI